jgi:hypothetical protein
MDPHEHAFELTCRIGEQLAEVDRRMRAALDHFSHNFNIDFNSDQLAKALERARIASEHLAGLGWTMPMSLSPRDIVELADKPADEVDIFFVDFYTANNCAELTLLNKGFEARASLDQWKQLLGKCFESFATKKHIITVPALLTVIDGVVAKAGNKALAWRIDPATICAEKAAAAGESVNGWGWNSLKLFFDKLFQPAPFSQNRPALINRNWILHGRDAANWTIADSLRLFNALQTIDSMME